MKLRRRSISVDDETWDKISGIAQALDRSTSDFVRIILKQYLMTLEHKQNREEK